MLVLSLLCKSANMLSPPLITCELQTNPKTPKELFEPEPKHTRIEITVRFGFWFTKLAPEPNRVGVTVRRPRRAVRQTRAPQLAALAQGLITSWTCCCFLASHRCRGFILFSDLVRTL